MHFFKRQILQKNYKEEMTLILHLKVKMEQSLNAVSLPKTTILKLHWGPWYISDLLLVGKQNCYEIIKNRTYMIGEGLNMPSL